MIEKKPREHDWKIIPNGANAFCRACGYFPGPPFDGPYPPCEVLSDEPSPVLSCMCTKYYAEIAKLREALNGIKQEIVRGKSIDCIGCCNGNDIPEEQLCRMCWRIWVNKKMYLLWDYKTTEARIQSILGEKEGEK